MASSSCSAVGDDAEASSSKSIPQADFLPSRDLPPLKRSNDAGQAQGILRGLEALEVALGLTREEEVRLIVDDDDDDDDDTKGSDKSRTAAQFLDDDAESSGTASRHDEVERRYAQSWLTRIASGSIDLSSLDCSSSPSDESDLVDRAARALAALCGRPASSAQITSFVFSTSADAEALVVARARIGDVPITADALGNRTWGAAPLLARRLVGRWARRPLTAGTAASGGLRVLELGAGTGLVGLALAATAAPSSSSATMHVDLTDYHPHVLANLEANARLNGFNEEDQPGEGSQAGKVSVRVRKLDWQAIHEEAQGAASSSRYTSTAQTLPDEAAGGSAGTPSGSRSEQDRPPPYLQVLQCDDRQPTYDTLIAADCIYDVHHPVWIRSVAERYLSRPSPDLSANGSGGGGNGGGVLWLITPLRETHKAELRAIYEAFPLAITHGGEEGAVEDGQSEMRLCITWQGDEVGYDDFGPKSLWAGGEASSGRSGLRTTYRTFEVRWV